MTSMRDTPDFAAAYPISADEDGAWLTPRTAYYLYSQLSVLGDEVRTANLGDVDWLREQLDWLPPIALRLYGDSEAWLRRFGAEADVLAERMGKGDPMPKNMAQQLLLAHVVRECKESVPDLLRDGASPPNELPVVEREYASDYDFEWCDDALFEDHDEAYLYSASLDGIESDERLVGLMGFGDTLHPDAWYTPFHRWGRGS